METLRQYILSVICAGILCGLMQMLFHGSVMKLIAGLFVTIVAISPIVKGELQLDMNWEEIMVSSQWAIREGEVAASSAMSQHIKEETQAYILSKAEELDANICVEVELSDDTLPTPAAVTIRGVVPPYTKKQLTEYMKRELGMEEDQQRWIS